MGRPLATTFLLAAAVIVIVLVAAAIVAAPAPAILVADAAWQPRSVVIRGAFHVHTERSDGAGSVDEVAAAAARAGLQFVILTDHGDGTRPPEPPAYRSGVLLIDGVEISTNHGHYATFGVGHTGEPLFGDGRTVVEAVSARGGYGVAAHSDSEKVGLNWSAWEAPIDGIEWVNLDSVWREAAWGRLARAGLTYWVRGPESLAALMNRPATLARFDELAARRPLMLIGATDAHGPIPSYEACFRTLTTRLELAAPLASEAAADARAVIDALAAGHHHTVIDALAHPGVFEFVGRSEAEWQQTGRTARQGDVLPAGGQITLEARVSAPPGSTLSLLRDGLPVRETSTGSLIYGTDGNPAVYRVEVRLPGAPGSPAMPWIVSNAIRVGGR